MAPRWLVGAGLGWVQQFRGPSAAWFPTLELALEPESGAVAAFAVGANAGFTPTESELVRMGWTGPEHRARGRVRPGLTGPVQVFGSGSAAEAEALEAAYLARKSVALDLAIVSLTASMVILGKGRVRRFLRAAAGRSSSVR